MNVGDKVKTAEIKLEPDDLDAWFGVVITALSLRNGSASSAIREADKVIRALQERRLGALVPHVPIDLIELPIYLAEKISVALQRLPTDLGAEWIGKRPADLAIHQGIVADAIAEALQSRSAEIEITDPSEQCTCQRDSAGARIEINPSCPLEVARHATRQEAGSTE